MLNKISLSLLFGMSALAAFARPASDILAPSDHPAYLQDSRGVVVRGSEGLCWRNGFWSPDHAAPGCDGQLLPPLSKPTAPPVIPPPLAQNPAPAAPPVTPPPPTRCDFTVTLQGDETFEFNRAELTQPARARLESEVLPRLADCEIERLVITGHADRLGSQTYNQRLSEKRAVAVASYLERKGPLAAKIEISGAGMALPIKDCRSELSPRQLITCLAANRRVNIDVRGTTVLPNAARP